MRTKQILSKLGELAGQGMVVPDEVLSDGWRDELASLANFNNEVVARVLVLRRQQQLLAANESQPFKAANDVDATLPATAARILPRPAGSTQ